MVKLRLLYLEVLKESGDFNKIFHYELKGNKFETSQGWKGLIQVNKGYNESDLKILGLERYKSEEVANVEYSIEGKEDQFKKTNYKEIIKILKTVFEYVKEYIEKNSQIKAITLFASDKKGDINKTDSQKTKLYRIIVSKNLPEGWGTADFPDNNTFDDNYNGFALVKNN